MSPGFSDAESRWLSQWSVMRDALAELKSLHSTLPQVELEYGRDIELEDEELSDLSWTDDLWDLDSEDDQDDNDNVTFPNGSTPSGKEASSDSSPSILQWLSTKCAGFAAHNPGLDAMELQNQIVALLVSDSSEDELQTLLTDILGFDDLPWIMELLVRRTEIRSLTQQPSHDGHGGDLGPSGAVGRLLSRRERDEALRQQNYEHKNAALAPAVQRDGPHYPHVYKIHSAGNVLAVTGKKYTLPVGSQRKENNMYEEYTIPATKVGTLATGQKLVRIADMDGLCRTTFKGYKTLNRMQSLVYQVAYYTSENMLICAPTGAGKTDAAMLTILNTIAKYISPNPIELPTAGEFAVELDLFKIVYVAPMKALASEITGKLGRRLAWLGIQVRELTGDMHLTKAEILQTQILVTTPEKWDVVTRKSSGDTELVQKVRLLIIDEVHMLHDERGAVIESLVARTQRQVESTQSLIRIVGLSATLPNYVDVADFLKVNRMAGLFYFDASFRPVPLEQHFIGVKGKAGSKTSKENLERTSFEKVKEMLQLGHQVMVFVHSRRDTIQTAKTFMQLAIDQECLDLFTLRDQPGLSLAQKDMAKAKGRELRDLFQAGFGIHHAGMARSDRNLVERLFGDGFLQILCCTATLAWGVNLPAAAVIIKGTQLYSPQEGKFVDVGILDVLQIFGRAGRPQFQDTGIGFIATSHDKLHHYLSAVTQQHAIESKFSARLVDNLNAEIALGTVTSVPEAVQWLGYSYMFVRMQREPLAYGIDWAEIRDDPHLVQRRREMIVKAARILQQSQMIIFNETTDELRSKDIGRIASQFYILQTSIEIFNTMMTPQATEADVLKMISMSGEFDNIQSRDNESKELLRLRETATPCQIDGGNDLPHTKTNILLQSYISRARVEDFALVSDTAYVAQNAARICRALFMIALNRRWGYQCLVLLSLCKSIEKQIWPYQHPLHQFDLPPPVLRNLDDKYPASAIENLRDMDAAEIGQLVHNQRIGTVISRLTENFPTLSVEATIAPLNRDILRIHLHLTPDFRWNDRHNGTSEPYWILIENSDTSELYHHEFFLLTKKKLNHEHELDFTIPLSDPLPSQIYVRAVSDRWLGAETVTPVSFQHLIRPDTESVYTDLLNLQPLPVSALKNPLLEEIYGRRFQFFNPMQTQIFHCLYHTPANVLLGSPTGSGKTVAAELAMWWAFREKPGCKVVYIAPMKALVRERVSDWQARLTRPMGLKLVELTGDNTPDTRTIRDADIIITTPEKWDGISRSWQSRGYVRQVGLVIIDEIHLLGGDRGPILEIIVSRMNYIAAQSKQRVRIVGMSTACANAMDLANWLGVKDGLFNFRHSVRPVPLEIYIDGFPEQRGFCPLMQSMNRPTFLAIKAHSPDKPTIVFVPSRRQTRLTARDLINFCGMEDNPRRFLKMSEDDLEANLSRVTEENLKEALSFGIGLHHAGLVESDRQLVEELFANNKIQVLVATATLAWGVNLPAHLVIVKGTQFYDAKLEGYKDADLTDVLQMLGRAGRPQFDTSGVARIFTLDAKKGFYKHFLHTGFPVESSLHRVLDDHLGAEISARTVTTKQDALDYLTWTFFFRRVHKNPSFYGLEISAEEHNTVAAQAIANDFMVALVDKALDELAQSQCVMVHSNSGAVEPTPLGQITSYYYLSHRTVRQLVRKAKRDPAFGDVLAWMSCASEYDELPVRHNEDLINAELSKNLPLPGEALALPMWDPHVKAFLLVQAFMSRIALPITDYVTDQNSVLDQSIRIIQASIDVLAEYGYLSSCLRMMTLLQCIKCARWPTDNPLSILPGVRADHPVVVEGFAATAPPSAAADAPSAQPQSQPALSSSPPPSLVDVAGLLGRPLQTLIDRLSVPAEERPQFSRAAAMLPRLSVTVPDASAVQVTVLLTRQNNAHSHAHAHVAAGGGRGGGRGGQQQQQQQRQRNERGWEIRVWAPRFPKPQTEGYFVLVCDEARDEILALKRVTWPPPPSSSVSSSSSSPLPSSGNNSRRRGKEVGGDGHGDGASNSGEGETPARHHGNQPQHPHQQRPFARATLALPPSPEARQLDVLVVSDAYVGMQWRARGGVRVPPAPTVGGDDDFYYSPHGGKGKGKGKGKGEGEMG